MLPKLALLSCCEVCNLLKLVVKMTETIITAIAIYQPVKAKCQPGIEFPYASLH